MGNDHIQCILQYNFLEEIKKIKVLVKKEPCPEFNVYRKCRVAYLSV